MGLLNKILIALKVRKIRKKYAMTEEGKRFKRYLESKKAGTLDYTVESFEEGIRHISEREGISEENAIELLLLGIEMVGG